jgi:hypothetical protein
VAGLRRPRRLPERDRTLLLTVSDRQMVARDENVVALTLTSTDGSALPAWHPGAHLDIHLPSGRIRQYSLCGDPRRTDEYRIAVRRIPHGGGGSIEVHDRLPVGSTVTTSGPRNAFPLSVPGYGSPTRQVRFIAGGIGITPILPMLGTAQRLGVRSQALAGDIQGALGASGAIANVVAQSHNPGAAAKPLAAIAHANAAAWLRQTGEAARDCDAVGEAPNELVREGLCVAEAVRAAVRGSISTRAMAGRDVSSRTIRAVSTPLLRNSSRQIALSVLLPRRATMPTRYPRRATPQHPDPTGAPP